MPAAGRLGDRSRVPADNHGCPGCAHPAVGPAVSGSPNVNINGRAALRVGDKGVHAACCGPNTWEAVTGSSGVFINGKPAHRLRDMDQHCGGMGQMIEGSPNVFVGERLGAARSERTGTVRARLIGAGSASMGSTLIQGATSFSSLSVPTLLPGGLKALVSAGAAFRFGLRAGLSNFLGTLIGASLPWLLTKGLPQLVYSTLGKVMGPLATRITDGLLGALTIAFQTIKVKGQTLGQWAEYFFTNVFDNLFDGPGRLGVGHCPVKQNESRLPLVGLQELLGDSAAQRLRALHRGDEKPEGQFDVTSLASPVLHRFSPIEYQYADDVLPISLPTLMNHAVLFERGGSVRQRGLGHVAYAEVLGDRPEPPEGQRDLVPFQLDIDDDFLWPSPPLDVAEATVYGRAIWDSKQPGQLNLEYVHLRSASWLPTKHLYGPPYHEGDGEAAQIIVKYVNDLDAYRLDGVVIHGHGGETVCDNGGEVLSEDGRPVLFIAHGSHAVAPEPGRRAAKVLTDWHPPKKEGDGVLRLVPQLIASDEAGVRRAVFTRRVILGAQLTESHPGHDEIPELPKGGGR